MISFRSTLFVAFLYLLQAPLFPAAAAQSTSFDSPALVARLITAENGIQPGARTISAGLSLRMSEGWKTYWRSPGEVGLPPEIDWSGSENLAAAEFQWPAPTRFRAFGIENFGYEKAVTYPIKLTLNDPGAELKLKARVSILVCSNVCVPLNFNLALSVPPGTEIDRGSASEIATWAARVPSDGNSSEIEMGSAALEKDKAALVVELSRHSGWRNPDVFPELGDGTAFGTPDIRLSTDKTLLWARLPVLALADPAFPLAVTITDDDSAVTFSDMVAGSSPPAPPFTISSPSRAISTLVWIAVIAFGGGVILNAMPCVLPVLSIKLTSALKISKGPQRQIRLRFLATTAGTIVFMWALALVVLGLQSLGYAVGWGTQFQNPYFLVFLIVVLGLFAASLFGMFDISLPAGISTRLARYGQNGYVGDFATGIFAAILATPCSAPLIGTAVAFALTGSSLDIFVVFTAMGIGLALPYLVVAARPQLIAALPKPGRWMLIVKFVLGILLLLTAVWLFWVLSGVSSSTLAWWVGGVLVTVVLGISSSQRGILSGRVQYLTIPMIALALAMPAFIDVQARGSVENEGIDWVAFQRADIARHVSKGHAVFVDVTADWCLTCKANKTLVLDQSPVVDALASSNVIAMQADWTRPNPQIQAYLEANNRFGIPFNIVYGPAAPDGLVLSEVLTSRLVMDALETALGARLELGDIAQD